MTNPALKPPRANLDPNQRLIRYRIKGGRPVVTHMGTYVYERDSGPDGPFILTLLRGPDRKDEANEPIMVLSGVTHFEIDPQNVTADERAADTLDPDGPADPVLNRAG